MSKSHAEALLQQALANPAAGFRPGQWEAIEALVNHRRRLLVVERTGWGKSSVYFITTRLLRDQGGGPTLIVSPLLALMRNQMTAAERLGIRAETINSTNRDDWERIKAETLAGGIDALLVAPERLANEEFIDTLLMPLGERIGLLVVDEAHCISDWGHDFRPDYRRLVNVLRRMPPNLPVLGTTATANNRVVNDIQTQLGDIRVQRGPLMRESLALQNQRLPDQAVRLAWLARHIPELPGTGIVYVLTKRDAEQVTAWLNRHGIQASAYYSGVELEGFVDTHAARLHLESLLLENRIKVLVATVALGMGYDKPDLGFVIHYQMPGSVVAYYQQVGRAGRAIERAYGILLSGQEDEEIHDYFRRSAFPSEHEVGVILRALEESDGLTLRDLEQEVNLTYGQIDKTVKYLSVENPAPVIKEGGKWRRTALEYRLEHERIVRLTGQREIEWAEMQAYLDSPMCLMRFLGDALNDPASGDCGRCANCRGEPLIGISIDEAVVRDAVLFLRRSEMVLEPRKQVATGAFREYGWKGNLPKGLMAEEGRILSSWGDAGWGRMVADDKHAGHFRDELVDGLAEMVRDRWQPQPMPTWVTCVPSQRHPELVPMLARRLAARLGLTFLPVLRKMHDNAPQKAQENRFHQCRNLDGVFAVEGQVPAEPVLLVDDIVDSRWTLTVAAALLREAGSGAVFPLTLATTKGSD